MKLKNHFTEKEIYAKWKSQKEIHKYEKWHIIYSVLKNPGKECKEISKILLIPEWKIFRTVENYNKKGKLWDEGKKRGGRRRATSYQSLEEEAEMMDKLSKKAFAGLILSYHDARTEVEQKLKRTVSDDYIWDLFKRHGWKKKVPRPRHPLKNEKESKRFKKNSPKMWQPPQ
jgi:transposase